MTGGMFALNAVYHLREVQLLELLESRLGCCERCFVNCWDNSFKSRIISNKSYSGYKVSKVIATKVGLKTGGTFLSKLSASARAGLSKSFANVQASRLQKWVRQS